MVEGDAVDADWLQGGTWTVDIAGEIYPCIVSLRPLYDPGMSRIRA
jgi:4-methylaminobutanoate oxidase (formaldehyde-forming)